MTLDAATIEALAEHLERCACEAQDTLKLTEAHPSLDWDDAYAIQDALRRRHLARDGRVVGFKCGLTSLAKMRQMGVETPIFGWLGDIHAVAEGASIEVAALIHPRIEPEIAFVLGAPLRGPGCDIAAVLAATEAVMPGLEIIDSRYRDFKFDLVSVVADNTSAARFVVGGQARRSTAVDLATVGVVMEKNGEVAATAAGAAVLGNPAQAVAQLANHLAARGEMLPAGSVILSGGVTEAVAVQAGDHVSLRVQGMGSVGVRFV